MAEQETQSNRAKTFKSTASDGDLSVLPVSFRFDMAWIRNFARIFTLSIFFRLKSNRHIVYFKVSKRTTQRVIWKREDCTSRWYLSVWRAIFSEVFFPYYSTIDQIEDNIERMCRAHNFSILEAIYMILMTYFLESLITFLKMGGIFTAICIWLLFRISEIAQIEHNFVRPRHTHYSEVKVTECYCNFFERKMRKNVVDDVNSERDLSGNSKRISIRNDRTEMWYDVKWRLRWSGGVIFVVYCIVVLLIFYFEKN